VATWWEQRPERWAQEVAAFQAAGLDFVNASPARPGVKIVRVRRQYGGGTITCDVTYPAEFPFFPPVISSQDVAFARHQAPGTRRLCLVAEQDWEPANHTAAWMLTTQWDELLRAQPGPDRDADAETRQAEPITAYMDYEADSFVGFPEYPMDRVGEHGTFHFALENAFPLRGTVLAVYDEHGAEVVRSDVRTEADYADARMIVTGRWVRLRNRPAPRTALDVYAAAVAANGSMQTPRWQPLPGSPNGRIDVIAVLFPDELAWDEIGGNVIVASKTRSPDPRGALSSPVARVHRTELESHRLFALRDPAAPPLRATRVAIAGLGSIGSPLARALAQSGVGHLNVVDFDTLEAGNAIRWESGRQYAGRNKAVAIRELVRLNYPHTSVDISGQKIGDVQYAGTAEERRLHDLLFHRVDLLADACASDGVSHFLGSEAIARGVPHLWLYASNGAWGGFIGIRDARADSPCWLCHMLYKSDGTLPPLVAAPDEAGVHPPQCLDPTFTGSQTDLMEVSLMAARLATDRLRTARGAQSTHAYPWTFATLALRDADGNRIVPTWNTYCLPPHADCPHHA
jgi:hypothetical protein